jgi:O-glycosyl hydrolase
MGTTTANDVAEYAEWLLAQVRRSRDQGIVLPFLSVANEPSYSRNPMSGAFLRDVIKDLGPRLRAEGFATLFVLSDDVRASDAAAKAQIVLSDPVARPYVGALATHLYDEAVSNVGQLQAIANQYQLPLWMTEFTVGAMGTAGLPANAFSWAALMHDLIATYNVSAVDYLWGFFGQWEGNTTMLVTLNNNGATYQGMTLNKQYYTTGQYSRFVRPGARRIQALSSANTVLTTAYLDRSRLVVVAINTDTVDHTAAFTINGVALPASATVQPTRTSASDDWATLNPLVVSGSAFTTTLAHNSVTTFVASTNDGIFVDGFETPPLASHP